MARSKFLHRLRRPSHMCCLCCTGFMKARWLRWRMRYAWVIPDYGLLGGREDLD